MRLGVSSSMGAKSASEWAKINKDLKLKSVVFPLNCEAPDEEVLEYVSEAKKNDLLIAEVGIWRNAIDADPALEKKNLEYSINQLRLADRIGARCCVNVAGAFAGARWDGADKSNFSKEAWKKTVKMIQTVIDEVNPKNTFFTMEPMPWMVPTGPREYLNLIEDVNRDRFAVHMDVINMINCPERYFNSTEFVEECFELLGDRIKSCHLKDILLLQDFTFQLRECACGEGTFSIERYAELATKADPDMPMIIEHLKGDNEYKESVAYVRKRLNL